MEELKEILKDIQNKQITIIEEVEALKNRLEEAEANISNDIVLYSYTGY